jgi:hypothetical protein
MEHLLSQVQIPPVATSMMGCLYGTVHTWDDSLTLTDLFGYSGHAFILNIERTLCPSGPTAWDWGAILFPLRQMLTLRRLCATQDMRNPDEMRELIWQRTVESIDAGRPVILWDLILPEFYLASGYDADRGEYLVQGLAADRVSGRVSSSCLGKHTGKVWALFPGQHDNPNPAAARDLALRGALNWYRWPNKHDAQWTFGGEAWDVWIAAMGEEEMAHSSSALSFNHIVYAECRLHAHAFLSAQGPAFAEAAAAYGEVANALQALCDMWPFTASILPPAQRRECVELLRKARDAEAHAVAALEAVVRPERVRLARA